MNAGPFVIAAVVRVEVDAGVEGGLGPDALDVVVRKIGWNKSEKGFVRRINRAGVTERFTDNVSLQE